MRYGNDDLPVASVVARLVLLSLCACQIGCLSYAGRTHELSFTGGGGIELRGTLVVPEGATAAVPAIVLLHGAEPATRDRMIYRLTGNVFLRRGIAVFVYDKRGAGESGGNHDEKTYSDLISDAVAAIDMLRQRSDVDAAMIGVYGVSESGWLTPEIAERAGNLAFVINKVGSVLSVQDTVAWEIYNELLDEGIGEQSARDQVEVYRRIWAYRGSPTQQERSALEDVLGRWAEREDSDLPLVLKEPVSPSYLANIAYDPSPFLERLATPMLYLYGTEDVNIPTAACVVRLRELGAAGKPVSFHVFEDQGHELGGFSPLPPWYDFVDGYADLIGDFAREHLGRDDAASR